MDGLDGMEICEQGMLRALMMVITGSQAPKLVQNHNPAIYYTASIATRG